MPPTEQLTSMRAPSLKSFPSPPAETSPPSQLECAQFFLRRAEKAQTAAVLALKQTQLRHQPVADIGSEVVIDGIEPEGATDDYRQTFRDRTSQAEHLVAAERETVERRQRAEQHAAKTGRAAATKGPSLLRSFIEQIVAGAGGGPVTA